MSIENNFFQSHGDYLAQEAIYDGIQLRNTQQESYFNLRFTNSELQKIQELIASLRLSKEAFLESAISYVHFRFCHNQENTQKVIIDESEKYEAESKQIDVNAYIATKERDRLFSKIKLSPETSKKLEELNMTEKINQCLFTGINLLYQQLIEDFKTVK